MGVQDDFGLWERELDEPAEPSDDRAVVVAITLLVAGCALLMMLGQAPLGVAGLVISAIILILWRVGM
jgi:hypothetical protein